MVVDYWRDVGCWRFEYPLDESELSFEMEHDGFYPMMQKVYDCFVVLEKYQLLFNRYELRQDEKITNQVRLDSFENFMIDSQKFRCQTFRCLKSRTCYFDEGGEGIVLSQSGKAEVYDNVVTFSTIQTPITVYINVHSTAFLPYTLDGYPQKEVYSYNAPRLTKAMREIEQCLGIQSLEEKEIDEYFSKYCLNVKGYRLVNFIGEDGTILGLNETGHVLDEDEMAKIPIDSEYLRGLI